jgi:membrane protease YdiL (CAAX protease family)
MVVSSSFIYTWMRLKSGSVWTGVLLHASHNVFIQNFFDPITTNTGHTKFVTGEFGVGLALISVCFGAYFWTRRNELPQMQKPLTKAAGGAR